MRLSAWLLFGLNGLATSSPLSTHTVHEKRYALPVAWVKHSRAPKDAVLPVRIGLNQRNLEHSDRYLEDISDPDSPNFGKIQYRCSLRSILISIFRKALDCAAGRQHFRTAPGSIRHYSCLACRVRYRPEPHQTFSW
jgi:hypothetical protein